MGRATGLHVLVAGFGLVVSAVGGVGHGILKRLSPPENASWRPFDPKAAV
jgi:hypothetical protein